MKFVVICPGAQQCKKHQQRKNSRHNSGNGRSPDTQLGKAPVTENNCVIQDQIHRSSSRIDPQHRPGFPPSAEKPGQGIGCSIDTAAQAQDLEIGHFVLLNQRAVSHQAENGSGKGDDK